MGALLRVLWGRWVAFATLAIVVVPSLACSAAAADAQPNASARTCSTPLYRQFDFWVGNWEVVDTGGSKIIALARIEPILRGCVLRENYQPVGGPGGQSLTIYDRSRDRWHQTWVTATGTLLEIEGGLENGAIILSGRNQAGALVRGVWKPVNGEVRETATTSTDGGRSWRPWFDITFRRSSKSSPAPECAHRDPRT